MKIATLLITLLKCSFLGQIQLISDKDGWQHWCQQLIHLGSEIAVAALINILGLEDLRKKLLSYSLYLDGIKY